MSASASASASLEDNCLLRWGIIATGMVASWFVTDLCLTRPDAQARHVIQAVGGSSLEKSQKFVATHITTNDAQGRHTGVKAYGSYAEVYADPDVDIVYIATPHSMHRQNCLDAIAAGKHVLCEKPFTVNAREAREVFAAAKAKGVFVMEGVWTRFFPLVRTLQRLLHEERAIGDVHRVFCDFAMPKPMAQMSLTNETRLTNRALGAGTLLDIGIYSLMWGMLALDPGVGEAARKPQVLASQSIVNGVDWATSMLLTYSTSKDGSSPAQHAILTSSSLTKTPAAFCRIEGTTGYVVIEGFAASVPTFFTVHDTTAPDAQPKKYEFERPGKGFYWEADSIAHSIAAGKTENKLMPWAETLCVMDLMDEVRRQGGAAFPQDEQ
ncbi:hypothetical protein SEUCBS139899_004552 [Sporothrix eucalyptigena]|uniref:D-xylose 1-dehydrogenase (NADP(+), D-xylono-1,5-lactone-forming) n=1 Tax=Sporothrix eucalyptigena TaxID=1812306 RepID=A0ABP0D205_9PEZI